LKLIVQNAIRAQIGLASKAKLTPLRLEGLRKVGGVDVAYSDPIAAAAYSELDLVTGQTNSLTRITRVLVDYIPGLLSFREAGPVLNVMRGLRALPDALLVNGHGMAHPRLCGLATHLGVVLDLPTIGVAKSLLGPPTSSYNRLFARKMGNLYVTPGNRVSMQDCEDIINRLPLSHGYPEPLGSAHDESRRALKAELRKES